MKKWFGLNRDITLLGIVSFLTDISSEMIFSVFSVFFTIILGASTVLLGIVEGLADLASSSLDYIAGYFSDRSGKRKIYALAGYIFSTLSKLILTISATIAGAFIFRIVERLGKSFRDSPRDAWIANLSNKNKIGYAFGLHKMFDKLGAILGPFIAYFLLLYLGQNLNTFKIIFLIALIPAVLSVFLLSIMKDKPSKPFKRKSIFKAYKTLGKNYRNYIHAAAIFSIAYFSFSFLLLKAYLVGFEIKDVVLLYALFNIAFVIISIPIGKIGDHIGRKKIILTAYILYIIMAIGFIFATTKLHVILLFIIFGFFFAIDEAQSKAYISDMEESEKATAIGFYYFITGLIYLPASIIAGYLWTINPSYTFAFAAFATIIAAIFFLIKGKDI